MSERQKVVVALLASVLLHLVVAGLIGLLWATNQHASMASVPPPKPLEVTLITRPMPEKKAEPRPEKPELKPISEPPAPEAKATPKPVLLRNLGDSAGLAESATAPKDPSFSSDINSVAGNEIAGTSDSGLPGQEGKERPFTFFENQKYSDGKSNPKERPELAINDLHKAAPIPQPTTVVQPTPRPAVVPPPPLFRPEPLPMSTPTPPPNPDALRIVKAAPTPQPTPLELPKPKPLPDAPILPTPAPTPQKLALLVPRDPPRLNRSDPGFQAQKEETKNDGGPVIKGLKGVDSVRTPFGRYRAAISKAISQPWNQQVSQHMDLITLGTVRVRFYVTAAGKVEDIKILSNTSTEAFATYTIKSITEAKIPVLPKEIVPLLENGRLEITEWSFTIYPE